MCFQHSSKRSYVRNFKASIYLYIIQGDSQKMGSILRRDKAHHKDSELLSNTCSENAIITFYITGDFGYCLTDLYVAFQYWIFMKHLLYANIYNIVKKLLLLGIFKRLISLT